MTARTWTRTDAEGSTATLTLDRHGAAMSVRHIDGRRDGWTSGHEEFESDWIPWLPPAFDDAAEEIRDALAALRAGVDLEDDDIP